MAVTVPRGRGGWQQSTQNLRDIIGQLDMAVILLFENGRAWFMLCALQQPKDFAGVMSTV